jgi:tetratricopeptide (TPR) repeat protein
VTAGKGGPALVATAGVLLAASLLFGGGSSGGPVAWIGGAVVLAAALAGCAALWGVLPVPAIGREGLACAGLAAAFVLWNGVTILWSSAPDRSWEYFNSGLVYLAFGVVGAFVGSVVAPRVVAWLVGGLVGVTCLWALAGKAIPALYEDYGRLARLRSPVGYWNALALVAAFGLPIALWAATRSSRRVRGGSVVGLYALLVTLVLTYSRGGILAALVALAAWFALSRERFDGATALAAAAVPAGIVLAIALQLPGVAEDGQPRSVRVNDGAWFALLFLLGAGLAFAAAYFVRYRPGPERERLLLKAAAGTAVALLAVGLVGALVAGGHPFGSDEEVSQSPSRLTEGSLNNRWGWWKEAWEGFEGEPLGGTGAGSFELLHRKLRDSPVDVREVHSLPLQFLSETGLVGFLLAGGAFAAALLAAWRALGRLGGIERAAAVALAVALPTFLVHGALDYDWDFVALCGPIFFVTGSLLAAGRRPLRVGREYAWIAVVVLVAWAGLYSIAAPRVAAARVDDAFEQIERGDVDQAARTAKSAHSLNPLSIAPLEAWAAAEEADDKIGRARELYVEAVDLQPLNWAAWYELGRFDCEVLGDDDAARRELQRAHQLDPHNVAVVRALDAIPCSS